MNGVTFAPFAKRGTFQEQEVRESLRLMKERLHPDYVIFVPNGLQETPQSVQIRYDCEANVSDSELRAMISYAQELGLEVALKPTANCMNGTWRAHISFFDVDVPCEPKWSEWFAAYTAFQLHYAQIAQETGCFLFIAGCEMVMSEHREAEWRQLIAQIRTCYQGLVSYNTDKYQEDRVQWWDCVDVIASSGYYPLADWEHQLDRIEQAVQKFGKPFLFTEVGCMSTKGSNLVPNNWNVRGELDLQGQADWFHALFQAMQARKWVGGCAVWSWAAHLYPLSEAGKHPFYEVYGKPAEQEISSYFQAHRENAAQYKKRNRLEPGRTAGEGTEKKAGKTGRAAGGAGKRRKS